MSSPRLLAEDIKTSPHNDGERTSNPVLDSVIIAGEAALCNALLYRITLHLVNNPLYTCLESAFALHEVLYSYERHSCDFLLPPATLMLLAS
jgi:hypothetical protein